MTNISKALAVSLLSGAFLLTTTAAFAQSNTAPPTTATRPTAPEQNSLPNAGAPPAFDHADHRADQLRSEGSGDEPEGKGQG